jgi:hypothetical protein
MEYTQGEWKIRKNTKRFIESENGESICSCWILRETDETKLDDESWLSMRERTEKQRLLDTEIEPEANAKLIAAAPELLESILYYKKNIDAFYKCIDFGKSNLNAEAISFMNEHLVKFTNVIKKATN